MRFLVFFLVLASAGRLVAQLAFQQERKFYEGQKVSSVDLIANPHLDVGQFRPLIALKAGEPYSEQKVQETIDGLNQTKRFGKIEVAVTPEPGGLRVSFVLEPAYYIGVIEFPEAAKKFSYTRLLQVVNLPDEDPYVKSRIPGAENALREFLQKNGYFQAQVQSETQLDDANQLANLVFHVRMGKRARIGRVDIQGTSQQETAHLLHSLKSVRARFSGGLLKSGKPYTPERMKAATALLQKSLARQHRLASKIHENPPQYRAETNRVDVSFNIELGPAVFVRTTGAKLSIIPFISGRQRKKLIPIYSEGAIDRDLVNDGQQNMVEYFQKKGYFDVNVKTVFQRQGDQISLVYEIDKGKKHKVDRIVFRGNHQLSSGDLLSHIPVKKSHLWSHGSYSPKLLKASVKNIEALYHDVGYEDVKVSPQVVDHEPKVDVTFEIVEGQQTLVDNLEVTGNQAIPADQLTEGKGFELRAGAPFSPGHLANDRNRITATYLDRGYPNTEVKPAVARHGGDPHKVDVTYQITEHQRVRISQVLYMGQKVTRTSMMKKSAAVTPEAPLSRGQLLEAQSRLYDLGVFDWSSVGPRKPITEQTDEETLIKVHEAKRNELTYGIGFEVSRRGGNTPSGTVAVPGLPTINVGKAQVAPSESTFASPRGSIEYTRRNLRGMAETGSISLLVARLDQRALATYTDPNFRLTKWNALTSISAERTTENPLFAASLGDASFQLERVLNKKTNTRLQLRYDFNKTNLSQLLVPALVLPRDRNVRLSTFSGTWFRDTRDKPLDAHRGFYETISLGITPTAIGSSANFARLFAQYSFYKPVHSIVWANSLRLGLAKPFAGSFVPTSQLFFSGGSTSLRGFPTNGAGPQRIVPFCSVPTDASTCVNITVPVGGRQLFILNSELRFPLKIMEALGGAVFYDGGNVYGAINFNQFVNNYTHTIGAGLRYATPIGPVRVDFGRNLNPVPGFSATQYFITLGQAF